MAGKQGKKKKKKAKKLFAISVCFPQMLTCMGVAVTCANQTMSLAALNLDLPCSQSSVILSVLLSSFKRLQTLMITKKRLWKPEEEERT